MRSAIRPLFLIVACIHPCPGPAQDATPESLLRNAVAKIRTFDSYTVEFIRYDEFDQTRSVHHRRLSFARPFRFRIEDLEPAAETVRMADGKLISQPACGRFVDVFSATLRWSFNKDLKQYSKLTFDPSKEDPAVQFAPRIRGQLDDVSLEPDETLSLGGRQYDCTVIRARYPAGAYLVAWIDKSRGYVIKFTAAVAQPQLRTTTVELISMEPHAELPDDLFTFEPPANWQQSSTYLCTPPAPHQ